MHRKPLYDVLDWGRERELANSEPYRTDARRDYARLVHSPAFRRLQGKTQLFPGADSDFFRNRLTHSIEVAQVAKSIAIKLNASEKSLAPITQNSSGVATPQMQIDLDLVEFASLAHDLGHPPFGHNGERALDKCMKAYGGFEGNAQSLRILSRLEKRDMLPPTQGMAHAADDGDRRLGLNLSYRSLAAILKYDHPITKTRNQFAKLEKGYYSSETALVSRIKSAILRGQKFDGPFKTIECQIMDIADDIAYSTYDLEDALKTGFISPLKISAAPEGLLKKIAEEIEEAEQIKVKPAQVKDALRSLVFRDTEGFEKQYSAKSRLEVAEWMHAAAERLQANGYYRAQFTSDLVRKFIDGVHFIYNQNIPALSRVALNEDTRISVESLKRFTFYTIIYSPRLKVTEHRGLEIVERVFKALSEHSTKGYLLLPDDFRGHYENAGEDEAIRHRVICDFVAGMTDSYCVELYARLHSVEPHSIFKPF